jgi:hypothetical protein
MNRLLNTDFDAHGTLFSHSEAGEGATELFVDARETLVDNEGNRVLTVLLFDPLCQASGTTGTTNLKGQADI